MEALMEQLKDDGIRDTLDWKVRTVERYYDVLGNSRTKLWQS